MYTLNNYAGVIAALNKILEAELAGVVRYTHYSLMVFGYNRIPIIGWLKSQATESLDHAHKAGEMITHLGGHPSLGIGARKPTSTTLAKSCGNPWSTKSSPCASIMCCWGKCR